MTYLRTTKGFTLLSCVWGLYTFAPAISRAESNPKQDTVQQQDATSAQIEQWMTLLQSDDFGDRELAARKLAAAGTAALPALELAASSDVLDTSRRAFEVIATMLDTTDDVQFSAARDVIATIAASDSVWTRKQAEEVLASAADPKICLALRDELSAAVAAADKKETHPDVVSAEFVEKLRRQPGFEFASGNRIDGSDWRESTNAADHPEVLVYRVRWFAGDWSQWFIPGINDADTKTRDGLMWRYFMDHEYELVSLAMRRGKFRTRDDFITTPTQDDKTVANDRAK